MLRPPTHTAARRATLSQPVAVARRPPLVEVDQFAEAAAREWPDLDHRYLYLFARMARVLEFVDGVQETVFGRYDFRRPEADVLGALRRAGPPTS